jgi:hypothetical protein
VSHSIVMLVITGAGQFGSVAMMPSGMESGNE